MAASTPARSEETEVVVDACKGDGANIWRGVSLTFAQAAVNSPAFFTGVAGSDHSLLIVSCRAFHCDNVNNGSGAGSLPFASLRCCSSNVFCIAAGMPRSSLSSAAISTMALLDSSKPSASFCTFFSFLNLLLSLAAVEGLSSEEDFFVFFLDFFFLPSLEELLESLEESELASI